MKNRHFEYCSAAFCQDDKNPNSRNEVPWYAGEKVCRKKPFQKFQKKQIEINKLFKKDKFKNVDKPYTANDLETKSI